MVAARHLPPAIRRHIPDSPLDAEHRKGSPSSRSLSRREWRCVSNNNRITGVDPKLSALIEETGTGKWTLEGMGTRQSMTEGTLSYRTCCPRRLDEYTKFSLPLFWSLQHLESQTLDKRSLPW